LNNTLFGKSEFKNNDLYNKDELTVEFLSKVVTDLSVSFKATDNLTVTAIANNLLNVLPEWKLVSSGAAGDAILNNPTTLKNQINDLTFNGRYSQMTYDGSHFSQLGAMFNFNLTYKF